MSIIVKISNKRLLISVFIMLAYSNLSFSQENAEKEANSLLQKANMQLVVNRNYDAALSYYEQASEMFRTLYGAKNRKYVEALKGIAECYDNQNNTAMAIKYYRRILLREDIWMTDYVCLKLGRLYQKIKNIDASIDAYNISVFKHRNSGGNWSHTLYNIYKDLFHLYYEIGNLSEAITVGKELCEGVREDRSRWIMLSTELATISEEAGYHAEALRIYHEILSVYERNCHDFESLTHRTNIAMAYHGIGGAYKNLGNHEQALNYLSQARDRYKSLNLYNDQRYATVLLQLSVCYSSINKRSDAISYAQEAYEVSKRTNFDETEKISALINYINILIGFNEHDEASLLLIDALGNAHSDKVRSLIYNSLLPIYHKFNDFDTALECAKKAVQIDDSPIDLHNLAICYSKKNMYDEAEIPLIKGWEKAVSEMMNSFMQNREDDYNFIWDKYSQLIKAPVDLIWQTDNDEIIRYAYNSLLMTKSIQLSSSISFKNTIENNNDSSLKELYRRWINTEEKHPEYLRIELEMLSKVSEANLFPDFWRIRWQDIRDRLKDGEIAVEFAHIDRSDTDEKAYIALILTPETDVPENVFISIDNTIERLNDEYNIYDLCNSSEIGNTIWMSIISAARKTCDDIKTIYFVPDGVLYTMPLEYMMLDDQRMNEKYVMRRLTSTREILNLTDGVAKNKRAALFGGIDYSVTIEDMEYYAYTMTRDISQRITWPYLPGTKHEVEEIDRILTSNMYSIDCHCGPSCVEESFKLYSGNSPEIIHIATHGFYLSGESAALKRCGLAFAGANNSLLGNHNIPDDIDDGILSASEISKLNLNNTDLVVMSACQTGLGDVTDDGVYGLQRAFKKAGVHSILMSLWSVDDYATRMLMSEFYLGLTQGMSKHDALMNAQQKIKQSSFTDSEGNIHNLKDPYFWAPFVLLE